LLAPVILGQAQETHVHGPTIVRDFTDWDAFDLWQVPDLYYDGPEADFAERDGFNNYQNETNLRRITTTVVEKDLPPYEVLIFSDEEESSRTFFSCESDNEGCTPSSSDSQEQMPDIIYQMPFTTTSIQKEPDQVQQKLVKRMPRSLRRTVKDNEKKKTGFACIKEVLIDDNYDYMLPPLPSGYKKKNQGCGWSRDLRPNDKYEYGPKYGVKLLKHVVLSDEATAKAKKIWLSVGTGDFDPRIMAQGFKLVGKLLYDSNYYNIKHVDCETRKCARQKLALVLSGHRLQRCDFVMRRPVPCKNRALRIWLKNYKFCLKNFCGLKRDRITDYLDELKTKNLAFMQGESDSSTASSFFEGMKSNIKGTLSYLKGVGSSTTSKLKSIQTDTMTSVLNSGTKMLVDSLFNSMYDSCINALKSGVSNIKSWLVSIKDMIYKFMDTFSDTVMATIPIDEKLAHANKSMWCCLAVALFTLITLTWWSSQLASSVFMSILAFSLTKIGVQIDRKSSKDFMDAIYSDQAEMQGCSSTFETFGKAFIGLFSLGTIGSVTNIIARMPQVKNNIKDFFMWLVDSIYSLFSKGKHFFPDYQEIDDMGVYMKSCVACLDKYTSAQFFTNDVAAREIMRLGQQVLSFRRVLALSSGLTSSTHSYYNNILVKVEKLSEEVRAQAWVFRARIEPTWFSMYGAPGQGKSDTYQIMPKHVYDRVAKMLPDMFPLDFHPGMVYEKASGQAYCDKYNAEQHFAFAIEELAAMADPKMRAEELGLMQKIISRAPLPLTCAELSMKNCTYYASPFVVTTSNITDDELDAASGLTRPTTIYRRRHFHVEVMIKPGHGVPLNELLQRPDECWIYRMHYTPSRGQWIRLALRNTGVDFQQLVKVGHIDFTFSQLADLMATKIINDYKRSAADRSFYMQNYAGNFGPPPPPPPSSSSSSGDDIPPAMDDMSPLDPDGIEEEPSHSSKSEDIATAGAKLADECMSELDKSETITTAMQKAVEETQNYQKCFDDLPSLKSEEFENPKVDGHAKCTKDLIEAWYSKNMDNYLARHVSGVKWFNKLDPWIRQQINSCVKSKKRSEEDFKLKILDRMYMDPQFNLLCEYQRRNLQLPPVCQTPVELPPRLVQFYTEDLIIFGMTKLVVEAIMQGSGSSEEELVDWQDQITESALEFIQDESGKWIRDPTSSCTGDYTIPSVENNPRYVKWDTRRIIAQKWIDAITEPGAVMSYVRSTRLYNYFFSEPAPRHKLWNRQGFNDWLPYELWFNGDSIQIDKYLEYAYKKNEPSLLLPVSFNDHQKWFWNRIHGSRKDRKNLYGDLMKLLCWYKLGVNENTPGLEEYNGYYLGHSVNDLKRAATRLSECCPAFEIFFAGIKDNAPKGINLPEGSEQCAIVARLKHICIETQEEVHSKKAKNTRPGRVHEFVLACNEEELKQYINEEVSFVKEQIPNDTLIICAYETYQALKTFWKGTKELGTGFFHTVGGFFYQYGFLIASILAGVCAYVLVVCGIGLAVKSVFATSAPKKLAKDTVKRAEMQSTTTDKDIKCLLEKQGKDEFVTFQSFSRGHLAKMSQKAQIRMQSKLEDSIDIQINNISNAIRNFVFYYEDKGREAHGLISGRRAFLNKHFFSTWGQNWTHMEIRNGDEVLYTLQPSDVHIQMDSTHRDLAWFDLGKGICSMPSLKRHLLAHEDYEAILGQREIARIHRLKVGGKITHRYAMGKGAARGEHKTMNAKLPNNKPFNLHLGEHFVTSGMESKNGDCGLPYVTTTDTGVVKILGLHCALANTQSVFLPLYQEDEPKSTAYMQGGKAVINQGTYIPSCVRSPTPERKQLDFDGRLVSLGSLPKGDFMPTETKIEASLFQGDLTHESIYPVTTAPAMLKPMTVDVLNSETETCEPVLRQPLKQGIVKMVSAPRRIFPKWMQELFEHEPQIAFAGFFPSTKRKFVMLTIEEAIQHLDMQASIGFDFKVEGFKSRSELWRKATETEEAWINPILRNKVMELFVAMKAGYEVKNVVSACLKDETRDLERVYLGKTRIFCVGSLAHLIMTIMVVGDVVFYMKENHLDTDVCIGINPHGSEWWILAEKLMKHKLFGGGDYSGFDSGITSKFGHALYLAMKWYINSGDSLYNWYLYNVCMSSIAPIFVINSECYWSDWMNSSGGWLTGFLNSFVNVCIFNAFHWFVCQTNGFGDRSRLEDLVCAFYGDDNLWSVCDDLKDLINMETLGEFIWEVFGMTYTTTSKGKIDSKFVDFDNLEFLCRKFRPRGNLYTAPLAEESIHGMLLWIKKSSLRTPADQLAINVEQAMMEYYHYGQEKFEREEQRIRFYCEEYNVPYTAGSYEYYDDRWGTGMMSNRS